MTTVAEAEASIKLLEDKRQHVVQKSIELTETRRQISYAAHTGDQKSRAKLDKINGEMATLASEIDSIGSAIIEGNERLRIAMEDEEREADRARAQELREKLVKFQELGQQLDDSCWDLSQSLAEIIAVVRDMHALGATTPTNDMFRINTTLALKSMLQTLPQSYVNDLEFQRLQPSQKKNFKTLVSGWSESIERNIAARLGDPKREAA
jgi:hypothetical protein